MSQHEASDIDYSGSTKSSDVRDVLMLGVIREGENCLQYVIYEDDPLCREILYEGYDGWLPPEQFTTPAEWVPRSS